LIGVNIALAIVVLDYDHKKKLSIFLALIKRGSIFKIK
jgi:hypothetical protein